MKLTGNHKKVNPEPHSKTERGRLIKPEFESSSDKYYQRSILCLQD